MNLKEIRDDVRSLIIEPTPGFRSNVELNRWINQGHQELAMLYRVETFTDLNIFTNTMFHRLPDDLLVFKGAWDSEGKSIPIIPTTSGSDLITKGFQTNNTSSLSIFTYGNLFALVPAPETNTSIKIFYEKMPNQLISDSDIPEIPSPYHRYIVAYAVMRSLQKDEDFEGASIFLNEFENGKALITTHKLPISRESQVIFELIRLGILNAAEAAEYLNLPMKEKIWNRVEVEEKGLRLLESSVISRDDLIKNTVFPDKEEIEKSLSITASDIAKLPSMWDDDVNG